MCSACFELFGMMFVFVVGNFVLFNFKLMLVAELRDVKVNK